MHGGTAVGLQKIDGLNPSAYLIDVAEQNIAGDLTLTWIAREEEQTSNDINEILAHSSNHFSEKTRKYIVKLHLALGDNQIFGRGKVMEILPLKTSAASELLRKLKDLGLIEEVTGHGKGKYRLVSLT